MATIMTDADAIAAVRRVNCGYCWAGPGDVCGLVPEGDHFARWARARRKGLITAEQAGAALDTLTVVTDAALVVTEALTPARALEALGAKWSPAFSRPGPLEFTSRDCVLCPGMDCECAEIEFGSERYFAKLDALHGRGGAK